MADPTGAGDAFRAGFLAGAGHRLGHEGAARLGCAMAALEPVAYALGGLSASSGYLLAVASLFHATRRVRIKRN